jgi:hypothetical protein
MESNDRVATAVGYSWRGRVLGAPSDGNVLLSSCARSDFKDRAMDVRTICQFPDGMKTFLFEAAARYESSQLLSMLRINSCMTIL